MERCNPVNLLLTTDVFLYPLKTCKIYFQGVGKDQSVEGLVILPPPPVGFPLITQKR